MEERITSMIPRYGKLNKTYTEITSGDGLSFEKQKFIHDFYKEYEDTQTFEKALISLMLETEGTHFSILLNSLKREIENNSAPVEIPDFTRGGWNKVQGYHHAFVK